MGAAHLDSMSTGARTVVKPTASAATLQIAAPSAAAPTYMPISMNDLLINIASLEHGELGVNLPMKTAADLRLPAFFSDARLRIKAGTVLNVRAEVNQVDGESRLTSIGLDFSHAVTLRNPGSTALDPKTKYGKYAKVLDALSHVSLKSVRVWSDGHVTFTGSGLVGPVYVSLKDNKIRILGVPVKFVKVPEIRVNTDMKSIAQGHIFPESAEKLALPPIPTATKLGFLPALAKGTGTADIELQGHGNLNQDFAVQLGTAHINIDKAPFVANLHAKAHVTEDGALNVDVLPTTDRIFASEDLGVCFDGSLTVKPVQDKDGEIKVSGSAHVNASVPTLKLNASMDGAAGATMQRISGGDVLPGNTTPAAKASLDATFVNMQASASGKAEFKVVADWLTETFPQTSAMRMNVNGKLDLGLVNNAVSAKGAIESGPPGAKPVVINVEKPAGRPGIYVVAVPCAPSVRRPMRAVVRPAAPQTAPSASLRPVARATRAVARPTPTSSRNVATARR